MKRETIGASSATLVRVTSRVVVLGAVVVVAAGAVTAAVALNQSRASFVDDHTRPLAVGDCVVVTSSKADEVAARRSSCGALVAMRESVST